MGFAPVDKPKIAIAVYVENGGFGAVYGVPIGSLMIEQYLNGKLTESDAKKANDIQKRHISYPFKRPLSHADSIRLDSIKRINFIKDSLKLEAQKQRKAELQHEKALKAKKDADEEENQNQPLNDPIIRMDEDMRPRTDEKERERDKDRNDNGKKKERTSSAKNHT